MRPRAVGQSGSECMKERGERFVRSSIAWISGEGKDKEDRSTHDGVEVGLHELFVEIHLIEVPIRAEDNVHIIQASDLCPEGTRSQQLRTSDLLITAIKKPTFLCLRK